MTNARPEQVAAEELLPRYRGRGGTEKDFRDWKSALRFRLSSTPRPKTHYRGRPLADRPSSGRDSSAVNDAWLLVNVLTANPLSLARSLLHRATGQEARREAFPNRILKTAACVTLRGRQVTVIGSQRAGTWRERWVEFVQRYPAHGSTASTAPPLPA